MYINIFIYLVNLINFKFINLHKKRFKKIFLFKNKFTQKKRLTLLTLLTLLTFCEKQKDHTKRDKKKFLHKIN